MIARVAVHVLVPLVAAEHGPPAQRLLPVLLDGAEALPLLAEVGQVVRVQLVAGHVLT